jgi:RimJ/RimL family protein N-acetyltransferase
MGGITLRAPSAADLDTLGRWRNDPENQRNLMWRGSLDGPEEIQRWIERRVHDPVGTFFVVSKDDLPVGFVQLTRIDAAQSEAHLGIFIEESERRSSTAAHALAALEAEARARGVKRLLLETLSQNVRALRFYRKQGYDFVKKLPAHFNELDVEVMAKLIA